MGPSSGLPARLITMRTVLVTGANGQLGEAIARAFLSKASSCFVWLGVRRQRERALKLVDEFPQGCQCIELEVTQPNSWREATSVILAKHNRIDVLVNNAGRHCDSLLATMSGAAWSDVLETNLDGPFHGCQAVLPTMVSQRNGRIINIASLSALLPPAGQANYAAAKAGLVALTQSLAKEVARLNITVNAVCPGFIETEALMAMTADQQKAAQTRVPMRRLAGPRKSPRWWNF